MVYTYDEGLKIGKKTEEVYLDPGFNVGVTRRLAFLSTTATFIVDGKEIAKVNMDKAPGQGAGGYGFDAAFRISESFEKQSKHWVKP